METPAKTALGGGLISALAIGGMVAAGVAASVVADPTAPPARAATGLTTFQSCDALQEWYVDHTIDAVGPYGWGGRMWTMRGLDTPTEGFAEDSSAGKAMPVDGSADGLSNGATGTNTQEAGVDEPDVAKTDGRIVVRLEGRRVVLTDVSGTAPRELAQWRLPAGTQADGLLLVGDHVLLSGSQVVPLGRFGVTEDSSSKIGVPGGGSGGSELVDLDISDPARPVLDSRTSWSGNVLSMRQYGDTVRLVTSTGLPALPFVQPRPGRLTEDEAKQRNREIVRASKVEDWVPGLSSESGSGPLVECDEVYHPKTSSGADTVAVATFEPGAVADASAVAVTGAGSEVYSSTDRLYVTSTDWGAAMPMSDSSSDLQDSVMPRTTAPLRTHVHAFDLAGSTTRYVASGSIKGTIRDRWSLDERDGRLRIAVSWPDRFGGTRDNGIVVLEEQGGSLEQVGELRGLGVREEIQSVRWFDDLAVVVTFRQTDPLYTVDLTDPRRPRVLGALKIPGFSSYLHPIGDDRLLGLGTDATDQGESLGAQAGVFDIADLSRTRQVGKVTFGQNSTLGATQDPHAFTWLPDARAAITSLERWDDTGWESPDSVDNGIGMVLLRVAPSGKVSTEQLPSPGGYQPRALPLQDGRVALVGSRVELVSID